MASTPLKESEVTIKLLPPTVTPVCVSGMGSPSTSCCPTTHSRTSLIWDNLSYTVKNNRSLFDGVKLSSPSRRRRLSDKLILAPQSGCLKSGYLVAVIGPSGAGKSTLLECLAGRKKGFSGDVWVKQEGLGSGPKKELSLSFIEQRDHLLGRLTVKESLTFASKIKNFTQTKDDFHKHIVQEIIDELNLSNCFDVLAIRCSGGQRKRLSIGLELISGPNILILDEPTSGLDSTSALQCVQLLFKLTESSAASLAIIASLHQPSATMLSLFHEVHILSYDGRCLYSGEVANLLPHLSFFDLNCPQFHNPADYAIEVASGVYGEEYIDRLTEFESDKAGREEAQEDGPVSVGEEKVRVKKVIDTMLGRRQPFFLHFYYLLIRSLVMTFREPYLNLFRFVAHIFIAVTVGVLYGDTIGREDGCVFNGNETVFSFDFVDHLQREQEKVRENLAYYFFSVMFLVYTALMPTILVFPLEMNVFIKERNNGWYSCLTYYLAKTLSDAPFTIFFAILFTWITYVMTGQINSTWRFSVILVVCVTMAVIGQSVALLVGAFWVHNPTACVFIGPVSTLPLILLSGFFIKISTIPWFFQPFTCMSYMRYAFEAIIIAIYGHNRCETQINVNEIIDGCGLFTKLHSLLREANISFPAVLSFLEYPLEGNEKGLQSLRQLSSEFSELELKVSDGNSSIVTGFAEYQGSFVLKQFELNDDMLCYTLFILVVFVVIMRVAAYLVLLFKVNRQQTL